MMKGTNKSENFITLITEGNKWQKPHFPINNFHSILFLKLPQLYLIWLPNKTEKNSFELVFHREIKNTHKSFRMWEFLLLSKLSCPIENVEKKGKNLCKNRIFNSNVDKCLSTTCQMIFFWKIQTYVEILPFKVFLDFISEADWFLRSGITELSLQWKFYNLLKVSIWLIEFKS